MIPDMEVSIRIWKFVAIGGYGEVSISGHAANCHI